MANRNFPSQRIFGMHLLPVRLDAKIAIGASGAPTLSNGIGIASIARLSTGRYRIRLQDNYYQFLRLAASFQAPVSGGAVNMGSLVTDTLYQIVTLGTSTQAQFVTAGVPSGVTAAPGVVFQAAGAGAGNGTVKALGSSGISSVEVLGNPDLMQSQPFVAGAGEYITFKCLGPTASGDTTPIATDPASGSVLFLEIFLNMSSVQ